MFSSGRRRAKRFKCFLTKSKRQDRNPQHVPGGAWGPCSDKHVQPPRSSAVQQWLTRVLLSQIDTLNERSEYARLDHRISFQTFDSSSCFLAWRGSQTGWWDLQERWCRQCTAKTGSGWRVDTNNTPSYRRGVNTADIWKNKTHQNVLWSFAGIYFCVCVGFPQTDLAARPLSMSATQKESQYEWIKEFLSPLFLYILYRF